MNFHFKMIIKICIHLSVQILNMGGQEIKVRAVYILPLDGELLSLYSPG